MQVALCEIPLAGDPEILRRERFETVLYRRRTTTTFLLDNTLFDLRVYQAV
jgi:hypothetical protein